MVPNWNGAQWLVGCLDSVHRQTRRPEQTLVVDNGSSDGSLELIGGRYPDVEVLALQCNRGFAHAANLGIAHCDADAVALVNTDVQLADDWLARTAAALEADPGLGSIATKMVDMRDPRLLYSAGDVLRRDGVCEQRGRFSVDDGRYDCAGDVFAACAGAGLYRRSAVLAVGGFDERFFAYLEDVDLGLRLQLAGWRCAYEPAVARHAGGGSSWQLQRSPEALVERNTLLMAARAFPIAWAPQLAYRQLGWAWHALRARRLRAHLGGAASALPLLASMARERSRLRREAAVPIEAVVPRRPIRGARG